MSFLNTILNIIFPTNCISCGRKDIEFCEICLTNSPIAERETLKWIFPIFDYRHIPIKKALWLLKYKNKKNLANIFGEILYFRILEELSDMLLLENFSKPILIPIPLSKERLKERGYNQAELICEKLINMDNDKNFTLEKNILIKIKNTIHQTNIKNRNTRLQNIINSFGIKDSEKNKIKNRNIILIDDITTTGATLSEAKKIFKKCGAKKIIAFTLAH